MVFHKIQSMTFISAVCALIYQSESGSMYEILWLYARQHPQFLHVNTLFQTPGTVISLIVRFFVCLMLRYMTRHGALSA